MAVEKAALIAALDRTWAEATAPGGPFEMEEIPFLGRTVRRYKEAPRSLREFWLETASFGDQDYLVAGEERLTYAQAHRQVANMAGWMAERGIGPGARVAIAMRNHPEWLIAYWACVCSNVSVVGVNAWWTAEELAHVLADADPKAVICDGERFALVKTALPSSSDLPCVLVRQSATAGAIAWDDVIGVDRDMPDARVAGEDEACLFYTSGTTGRAKGARLTHAGCVNVVRNIQFALEIQAAAVERATGEAIDLGSAPKPVGLVTTPLFHVTANNCFAQPITAAGGALVMMHKWDPAEALRLVEAEGVTSIGGVPTMTREFLAQEGANARNLATLGTIMSGGAPLPPDLVAKTGAHGGNVMPTTGFGMTELTGAATGNSGHFLLSMPQAVGRAMPTFDARVIGEDDEEAAPNETGELCFRGIGVFAGYLGQAEATADILRGGWLRTGDIARIDEDGYIHIVDRKKNMVLRGGENVYAAEVEAALSGHPDIREVAVFGVPDERLGEEVGAAIRLWPGREGTPEELRASVRGLIAEYKIPRYVWITDEPLPRNASGKVVPASLRTSLSIAGAS